MRHTHPHVYISVCVKKGGKKNIVLHLNANFHIISMNVAIIFEMALTGVPAKTTDLPHITDTFFQNIYTYMIKSLVKFYNKKLFRNE